LKNYRQEKFRIEKFKKFLISEKFQTLFEASASCSKILNDKHIVQNLECKRYIQYSERFRANSVFQGKGKVAQNDVQGRVKLLKNPEW